MWGCVWGGGGAGGGGCWGGENKGWLTALRFDQYMNVQVQITCQQFIIYDLCSYRCLMSMGVDFGFVNDYIQLSRNRRVARIISNIVNTNSPKALINNETSSNPLTMTTPCPK